MTSQQKTSMVKTPVFLLLILSISLFTGNGCRKTEIKELYHRFPEKVWARFNILSFEIPVNETARPYNIYMFGCFSRDFKYETLDFNMIMNTSAGEERTHVYQMEVKSKSGTFLGECNNDTCRGTIMLKKELRLAKPGILKIEIENLIPRLITEGVLGVGIRMVPSGK